MGFALISEGFLSACYHVCPTTENFQFDTTFMYVIAVLCFIKIYQFRHSDASSNAYKVFIGIAMIMFLEVLGIFLNNTFFWIFSLVLYFLAMLLLSSVLYHAGKWSMSHMTIIMLLKVCLLIFVLSRWLLNSRVFWVVISHCKMYFTVKLFFFVHSHVLAKQEIALFFQVRSQRNVRVL